MSLQVNQKVLNRGWKRFTIMHKDRRVASIREDGTCTIYSRRFMPFNLYLERAEEGDLDTRLNNLSNFYYWCSSRVLTLDRRRRCGDISLDTHEDLGGRSPRKDRAFLRIPVHE